MRLSTREFLTGKQERFVREYLVDFNGTQAAIRAGYSPDTARSIASELLGKNRVSSMIDYVRREEAKLFEISRRSIISKLNKIAFADLGILLDKSGKMKPPHVWTAEMVHVVASFKIVHHYSGRGKNRKLEKTTYSVKMKDQLKALDLLAKHLGASKP
jgi:phage terminase small subunit